MTKFFKLTVLGLGISALAACGGGSSSSDNANGCLATESVEGGVNFTNNCDEDLNVALFDPLFRFRLDEDETIFIARTGLVRFGACERPFKPREDDDSFRCTI